MIFFNKKRETHFGTTSSRAFAVCARVLRYNVAPVAGNLLSLIDITGELLYLHQILLRPLKKEEGRATEACYRAALVLDMLPL